MENTCIMDDDNMKKKKKPGAQKNLVNEFHILPDKHNIGRSKTEE
jgi:hypothetical protein